MMVGPDYPLLDLQMPNGRFCQMHFLLVQQFLTNGETQRNKVQATHNIIKSGSSASVSHASLILCKMAGVIGSFLRGFLPCLWCTAHYLEPSHLTSRHSANQHLCLVCTHARHMQGLGRIINLISCHTYRFECFNILRCTSVRQQLRDCTVSPLSHYLQSVQSCGSCQSTMSLSHATGRNSHSQC